MNDTPKHSDEWFVGFEKRATNYYQIKLVEGLITFAVFMRLLFFMTEANEHGFLVLALAFTFDLVLLLLFLRGVNISLVDCLLSDEFKIRAKAWAEFKRKRAQSRMTEEARHKTEEARRKERRLQDIRDDAFKVFESQMGEPEKNKKRLIRFEKSWKLQKMKRNFLDRDDFSMTLHVSMGVLLHMNLSASWSPIHKKLYYVTRVSFVNTDAPDDEWFVNTVISPVPPAIIRRNGCCLSIEGERGGGVICT